MELRSVAVALAAVLLPAGPAGAVRTPTWELIAQSPVESIAVNERLQVEVELRNPGPEPWDPAAGDRLAYHWLDANDEVLVWDGERSTLPGQVSPGQSVQVSARLYPPDRPGRHRLRWEMLRENVAWFGPPQAGLAEIVVEV